MKMSGLTNPVISTPPGRNTRNDSRQTGASSGQNTFDTRLTTASKLASGKALRSRMSPSTVRRARPSRAATSSSRASCPGELSNTVTSAPAAASTGPCCPPPEARQRIAVPVRSAGNHSRGVGWYPIRTTDQSPARARATTSGPTGRVHSLPRSTSRSHALRLCATGSNASPTAAHPRPGRSHQVGGRRGALVGCGFGRQGEGDPEGGALAGGGVHADRAAVGGDQGGDDRQAEPCAAGPPGPGLVSPVEAFKDPLGLLPAQPRAPVGDLQDRGGTAGLPPW